MPQLCPRPRWGSLHAPPDLAVFKGPSSKGKEEEGEEREEGKGKGRGRGHNGREGRGRTTLHTPSRKFLATPLIICTGYVCQYQFLLVLDCFCNACSKAVFTSSVSYLYLCLAHCSVVMKIASTVNLALTVDYFMKGMIILFICCIIFSHFSDMRSLIRILTYMLILKKCTTFIL